MKQIFLFIVVLCLTSCASEDKKKAEPAAKEVPLNERPIPPNPNVSSANVVGGAHYLCPQKHAEGNSAAAGTCPKCQSALVHNQGFHQPQNNANQPNNGAATQTSPTNTNAPNAKGEYHYKCTNGCAGGSGSAGNCATCGNTLVHNQAYHS